MAWKWNELTFKTETKTHKKFRTKGREGGGGRGGENKSQIGNAVSSRMSFYAWSVVERVADGQGNDWQTWHNYNVHHSSNANELISINPRSSYTCAFGAQRRDGRRNTNNYIIYLTRTPFKSFHFHSKILLLLLITNALENEIGIKFYSIIYFTRTLFQF